jgi:hypothetical protein
LCYTFTPTWRPGRSSPDAFGRDGQVWTAFPPPPEDWSTVTALEVLDIRDVAVTTEDRAANAAETPHVVGK